MSKHGKRGLRRLADASRYSLAGLVSAWHSEEAFRQEVVLLIALVPLALWLGRGPLEWVLLIGCWLLVMIVELLNTAVEYTVDRIGPHMLRNKSTLPLQWGELGEQAEFGDEPAEQGSGGDV